MRMKTEKMLPKTIDEMTNGGVYVQAVRCGKSNCHCTHGTRHTAFYFFTRRNGKRLKFYIRKTELNDFFKLANSAKEKRQRRRRETNSDFMLLKHLRRELNESDSIIKNLKRKLKP